MPGEPSFRVLVGDELEMAAMIVEELGDRPTGTARRAPSMSHLVVTELDDVGVALRVCSATRSRT